MAARFRLPSALVGVAAVGLLAGCEQAKQALGQGKNAPDEFAVFQRAPLSLPPDYGLRPPAPGSERPQAVSPRDQARAALGIEGRDRTPQADADDLSGLSQGERAVLQLVGASEVPANIRNVVNRETAAYAAADKRLIDRIVFWRDEEVKGTMVDPVEESRRLRANQAAGRPLNEGAVPVIERREKALFER